MTLAPSPITKPSRSLSKGREAFSGSSFRNDRALRAQKPASPRGVTVASVPPVRITSASPYWIVLNANPMAWDAEAQAEATA